MLVNTATVPELVAVPTTVSSLNDRLPNTPAVSAMLIDTATVPELVAVPTKVPVLNDRSPDTPCCKPPSYVPYKGTYVLYDGTFCAPDQDQTLDV